MTIAKKSSTLAKRNRQSSEDRRGKDRRQRDVAVAVERRKAERREKVPRRRQIDPTTCEREYSDDEIEFMRAMDLYKRTSGRMFPTCSEILEVIRGLGYVKVASTTIELSPEAVVAVAEESTIG